MLRALAGSGVLVAHAVAMAGATELAAPAAGNFEPLTAFLRTATAPGGYLGAVALVARNGTVLHWQAYGHRDLARSEAMPSDAIFRIYSMSKPIASVAALMLVEQGRLALDDPVARHLPDFAALRVFAGASGDTRADAPLLRAPATAPTVRHLLTHTAGFATGGPGIAEATRLLERAAPGSATTLAGFASRVATAPLAAEPGTRFGYDGVNTEVLSRVVEVASGLPFEVFVQRRIFDPLGMRDTGFAVPDAQRARIAEISAVGTAGTLVRAAGPSADMPGARLNAYASGAGGLYSTAPDYLRFARMLLNGDALDGVRLLKPETVALMTADQLAQVSPLAGLAPGEGFGLGVSVITDPARRGSRGSAGAYGWSGAASTTFTVDPQRQLVALLLMQHLPASDDEPGAAGRLPKLSVPFYNLVYDAMDR